MKGSTLFLEYDLSDQSHNWSGTARAPAADNPDKNIRDDFSIVGGEFAFDGGWSGRLEVPLTNQTYKGDDGFGVHTFQHAALGDVRVTALYSGLLDDGSVVLLAGFKLPTGDIGYRGFARDTQIGTGSTDLLIAVSYGGALASEWDWSAQVAWSKPLLGNSDFMPGSEVDSALTLSYGGFVLGGVRLTPSLQASGSTRTSDSGPVADPGNTGCDRIMLSPGLEIAMNGWKLYGDVEFPVYQHVVGDQVVAPELFKFVVSYDLDG